MYRAKADRMVEGIKHDSYRTHGFGNKAMICVCQLDYLVQHLSRTCIVDVTRLLWPCFMRVVVCCCSLFKFFLLLGLAALFFQLVGKNKSAKM